MNRNSLGRQGNRRRRGKGVGMERECVRMEREEEVRK